MDTGPSFHRPDPRLASLISHYWLSRNATANAHTVLPDGCVDLVLRVDRDARFLAFGTSTRPSRVPVAAGASYLGIRFRPGMSRHFPLPAARLLTDGHQSVRLPAGLHPEALAGRLDGSGFVEFLNQGLLRWLSRRPPVRQRLEAALATAPAPGQSPAITAWAERANLSPRQLERLCGEHLGLTPKTYLNIRRAQRALALLTHSPPRTASEVALAAGYADQSHLNRELRRYMGMTPGAARLNEHDVAFVQDQG